MKARLAALSVAATTVVLLLSGCTSEVTQESITITPGQTGTFSNGDTTVVVEGEASPGSAEGSGFVEAARAGIAADSMVASATDEQLIAAGEFACSERDKGVDAEQIVLTVGGASLLPGDDSVAIVNAAEQFLCD